MIARLDITATYGLLVAIAASLATVAKAPWPILAQRVLGFQMVFRHPGFRLPIRNVPALPSAPRGFVAALLETSLREARACCIARNGGDRGLRLQGPHLECVIIRNETARRESSLNATL
jgi:hypothetical protein